MGFRLHQFKRPLLAPNIPATPPTVTLTNAGLAGTSIVNYGTGPSLAVNSIESANSFLTVGLDGANNAVKITANTGTTSTTLAIGNDSRFLSGGTSGYIPVWTGLLHLGYRHLKESGVSSYAGSFCC